jgi:hypothetical protein
MKIFEVMICAAIGCVFVGWALNMQDDTAFTLWVGIIIGAIISKDTSE